MSILRQYEHNTRPGTSFEPVSELPALAPRIYPVHFIAYYLPQFHEIAENNEWWGQGFTEWTNTTKCLPRYQGHYQPKLPADLGFYDLSNTECIRRQVELANRAGIYGFCIHNYWFGGRTVLDAPLELIYRNQDIPIRYCLNWANESWSRRWDGWDGAGSSVLLKQTYEPDEDLAYARYVSRFFQDSRYIRINGRPLLMLYRPNHVPDARGMVGRWRDYFHKNGLDDPYIVMPQAFGDDDPRTFGMDAAAGFPPHKVGFDTAQNISLWLKIYDKRFAGRVAWYDDLVQQALANQPTDFRLLPGVFPNWDNDARKPNESFSVAGSSPEKFHSWLFAAAAQSRTALEPDERIVFINAWNEWAEGAYLEPDRHYGAAYLLATRRAFDDLCAGEAARPAHCPTEPSSLDIPVRSTTNVLRNLPRRALRKVLRSFQGGKPPSSFRLERAYF